MIKKYQTFLKTALLILSIQPLLYASDQIKLICCYLSHSEDNYENNTYTFLLSDGSIYMKKYNNVTNDEAQCYFNKEYSNEGFQQKRDIILNKAHRAKRL